MPTLLCLQLLSFRNLSEAKLQCSPYFNVFYGPNGAGKTSLLEAIYYLGFGRSFRTHHMQRIVQYNAEGFSIFMELQNQHHTIPIGIERKRNGECTIKCNGDMTSLSGIAKYLPLQFMSTMSYKFFLFGPKIRRQFLDWMLFHVEHLFYDTWQSWQRALKQRNAGLKTKLSSQQINFWNNELIPLANKIDELRTKTLIPFEPIFSDILKQLLPQYHLKVGYSRGWGEGSDLADVLTSHLQRDYQLGYTQYGPHRADLNFLIDGIPAQEILSQGQQKLVLYAFHLAQGLLLKQQTNTIPIYLIDDLPSELDPNKRRCIIEVLKQLNAQVFITGINAADLEDITVLSNTHLFHVEQGRVVPSDRVPCVL